MDKKKFKSPPQVEWATFIPDRTPNFKMHNTKQQAMAAMAYRMPNNACTLLHFENGEWVEEWDYQPSDICNWCGGSVYVESYGRKWAHRHYPPQHKGTRVGSPVICDGCYKAERLRLADKAHEERERKQYEELKQKYGE